MLQAEGYTPNNPHTAIKKESEPYKTICLAASVFSGHSTEQNTQPPSHQLWVQSWSKDKKPEVTCFPFSGELSCPESACRRLIFFYLLPPSVDVKLFTNEKLNLLLPSETRTAPKDEIIWKRSVSLIQKSLSFYELGNSCYNNILLYRATSCCHID